MMIRAILVDDEKFGREALQGALKHYCPEVEILASCSSAKEGLTAISVHQPDLVFLDIQMPHMTGFDMLQEIGQPDFDTIFVTAHDSFALKAIKYSAFDYLLKPLDIEELVNSMRKYQQERKSVYRETQYQQLIEHLQKKLERPEKLAIPTSDGMEFIQVEDIIFCQASGNYTVLQLTRTGTIVTAKTLKELQGLLEANGFCRVHHAYLINLKHIQKYIKGEGGQVLLTDKHEVDISRRRKDEFLRRISKL
ncbi:MAG: response regulator [Bacteroidota bacterium]